MAAPLANTLMLTGQFAVLEPLAEDHFDDLCLVVDDGELWNLTVTIVPNRDQMADFIEQALKNRQEGHQYPFIVRRLSDNKIVGCTRYYNIKPENKNLSIGFTWYSKSAQRTAINTECKLMLLDHAFEQLGCISVAFHVDDTNLVSQSAVKRLGAVQEGILRNDRIMPDGRIRHTHCFSIIDSEWPTVKKRLSTRLNFS